VKRRDFLGTLLGSLASAPCLLPERANAEPAQKPVVIGILGAQNEASQGRLWKEFVERLRAMGWIERQNIVFEYRWADAHNERFGQIAAEFVRLNVDLIATSSTPTVIAAKQATSSIPIVFANASDPVANGLVASLSRPGGNATGLSTQLADSASKRIGLLREIAPGIRRLAIMAYTDDPAATREAKEADAVARRLGLDVLAPVIRSVDDIEPAFNAVKGQADGLYFCNSNLFNTRRRQIVSLTVAAKLPAVYDSYGFVDLGGLISYGPNGSALFRRAAELVDKILRGATPADIPVEQPTEFIMAANTAAAKALGVEIPQTLLLQADRIVE
jgi:putative ABC transport system substrate-binding protein